MRTKIIYHKHLIRNVYLSIYFTCFHSLIFYISLNQLNVVYFFRRISFFDFTSSFHLIIILSRYHFISLLFHLIVISSRCHFISLSFHLVVILHHFRKMNSQNFVFIIVSDKKTTNSRILIKMIQVKTTSIKAASVKKVSVKRDRRISIQKTINRIIIEVKKIVEKKSFYQQKIRKLQIYNDFY